MRAFDALDQALVHEAAPLSLASQHAAADAYWYALVLVRTAEGALASAPHASVERLRRSACRILGVLERIVGPALIVVGARLAPEREVAPRRDAVRA
jgi:hypothetical protein